MPDSNLKTVQQTQAQGLEPVFPGQDPNSAILYPAESRIQELYFTKINSEGDEIRFDVLPWDKTVISRPPFGSIAFKESIFDSCMFGSIVVFDDRNWIDEFKFSGNEKIHINFKIGSGEEQIKVVFHVYNAQQINIGNFLNNHCIV